jgi:hypothetical protein
MLRLPYNLDEPGHIDHCGLSASGEYVHTLQMVDIATGWVELVAVLGKSYLVMQDAFLISCSAFPSLSGKFILTMIQPFSMLTSSAFGKRKFLMLFSPAAAPITRMITGLLSSGGTFLLTQCIAWGYSYSAFKPYSRLVTLSFDLTQPFDRHGKMLYTSSGFNPHAED